MDYPFGVCNTFNLKNYEIYVAILVLVDYPFGEDKNYISQKISLMVAILVLVDYPFGDLNLTAMKKIVV